MRGFKRYGISLRARALQKLCEINSVENSPLSKLINSLPISYSSNLSKLYSIPLTLNEFEIIMAICDTAPNNLDAVESIINQLIEPYFANCSKQRFTDVVLTKFKANGFKNPLEVLSYKMTIFLVRCIVKFPSLTERISFLIDAYFQELTKDDINISALLSLMGYMEAISDGLKSSDEISEFHWSVSSNLSKFLSSEFLLNAERAILKSVSNDILVDYYDHNREICSLTFISQLGGIQTNLLKTLFGLDSSKKISEYLLKIQDLEYQDAVENPELKRFKMIFENYSEEINCLCSRSEKLISDIENGTPYMNFQTYNTVSLAYSCKIANMEILAFSLFLEEDEASILSENLVMTVSNELNALQTTMVIDNSDLLQTVINVASLLNFFTEKLSSQLLNVFPLLISSPNISTNLVISLSSKYAIGLKPLSEDSIVGTIYSLNNLLAVTKDGSPLPLLKERKLAYNF